jgi:cell wall assembly regulator SMI1
MSHDIQDIWQTVEQWCARNAPALADEMADGASDRTLAEAGEHLEHPWPGQLETSLRLHDGWSAFVVHGTWRLLSAAEIAETWRRIRDIGFGRDPALPAEGNPNGPVEPVFWSDDWLPVAEGAEGRFACLDLAPPEEGNVGQVVEFWHQDPTRHVRTSSFADWYGEFVDELVSGGYWLEGETSLVPSEDEGGEHREATSARAEMSGGDTDEAEDFLVMLQEAGMVELDEGWRDCSLVEPVASILVADDSDADRAETLVERFQEHEAVESVTSGAGELSHLLARW